MARTLFILLSILLMSSCTDRLSEIRVQNNPLPDCPETSNCFKAAYKLEQSHLAVVSEQLLGIFSKERTAEVIFAGSGRMHVTYTIPVFGWVDDVHVQLESTQDESTILYIRSASRTGTWDIGVNQRRVNRIIRKISYIYPDR